MTLLLTPSTFCQLLGLFRQVRPAWEAHDHHPSVPNGIFLPRQRSLDNQVPDETLNRRSLTQIFTQWSRSKKRTVVAKFSDLSLPPLQSFPHLDSFPNKARSFSPSTNNKPTPLWPHRSFSSTPHCCCRGEKNGERKGAVK